MLVYNGPVRASAGGQELYGHGTQAFPCGCYYNDPYVSEVPWHWHEEIEVVFVKEGEMAYLASGTSYHLRPGDAVFVNSGVPHAERACDGAHSLEGDLVFHPRLLFGSEESAIWQRYLSGLKAPNAPRSCMMRAEGADWEREAISCIERAHTAVAEEERYFEIVARDLLTKMALLILDHAEVSGEENVALVETFEVERVKQMARFVEDHYADRLSVADVASAGNVSEREAQRAFRRALGVSPMEYLANYRLFVASQMLKSTDATITEVGRSCGFASQSTFARRFRERYGHAPSEHRAVG